MKTLFKIIFSLIFVLSFSAPIPTQAADLTCSCNLVLEGVDASRDSCKIGANKVKINIGDGSGEFVHVEGLFEDSFGQSAVEKSCYPLRDNHPFAVRIINARDNGTLESPIITKDNCSSIQDEISVANFSAPANIGGYNGAYALHLTGCSISKEVPKEETQGTTIESYEAQIKELNRLNVSSLEDAIGMIIKTAMGVMGTIALIMCIYGGFLWMTAGGNASQIEKAQNILFYGAVGVFVIFGSYAIITLIFESVNPQDTTNP